MGLILRPFGPTSDISVVPQPSDPRERGQGNGGYCRRQNGAPYEPSFLENRDIREILEALSANENVSACDNSRSSGANRGDCYDAIHTCVEGLGGGAEVHRRRSTH
jgi:hypothetical protein